MSGGEILIAAAMALSAGATIYSANKQEKATNNAADAQRAATAAAEERQRILMGQATSDAEAKQAELAGTKAALESELAAQEAEKQTLLTQRKETLKRGRSTLMASTASTWESAAPVFRQTLANPFTQQKQTLLGGA